jgi:hypothetical protein
VLWAAVALVALLFWLFPDAVSRFRQSTMPYAEMDASCSLAEGPCEAVFPDGVVVSMTATPQPVGPADPVRFEVRVEGAAVPRSVELQGVDMAMGLVQLPLEKGAGKWTGQGGLPVCTTDRMQWRADVILDDRVAGFFLWATR